MQAQCTRRAHDCRLPCTAPVALCARQLRLVVRVEIQQLFKNMQSRLPRGRKEDTASESSSDKPLPEDPGLGRSFMLSNARVYRV